MLHSEKKCSAVSGAPHMHLSLSLRWFLYRSEFKRLQPRRKRVCKMFVKTC